jgi:hypothetical protein
VSKKTYKYETYWKRWLVTGTSRPHDCITAEPQNQYL